MIILLKCDSLSLQSCKKYISAEGACLPASVRQGTRTRTVNVSNSPFCDDFKFSSEVRFFEEFFIDDGGLFVGEALPVDK